MKSCTFVVGKLSPDRRVTLEKAEKKFKLKAEFLASHPISENDPSLLELRNWSELVAKKNGATNVINAKLLEPTLLCRENLFQEALMGSHLMVNLYSNGFIFPLATNRLKLRQLRVTRDWNELFAFNRVEVLTEIVWMSDYPASEMELSPEAGPAEQSAYYYILFQELLGSHRDTDDIREKSLPLLGRAKNELFARKGRPDYAAYRNAYLAFVLMVAREFSGLDSIRWLDTRLRKKRPLLDNAFNDLDPNSTEIVVYGAGSHTKILLQILRDYDYPYPSAIVVTSANQKTQHGLPVFSVDSYRPSHPNLVILISSISYEDPMKRKAKEVFPKAQIISFWKGSRNLKSE